METILGYPITTKSKSSCITEIIGWVGKDKKPKYFVCANPHSLKIAKTDPYFDKAIRCANLVIPDGIGIVIGSKILNGNIKYRITGSDIFTGVSEIFNRKKDIRYFFLGSTNKNLKKIKIKMREQFPNIHIVGTYSPPYKADFSVEDNQLMINKINKAKPDILWVGMTAPKQEKWILKNIKKLNVKVIGAIGAVFDFYTGTINRSHPWFQKHGVEWLPRLIKEPHRLWRRNFISGPIFLLHILKEYYRRGKYI